MWRLIAVSPKEIISFVFLSADMNSRNFDVYAK